MIDVDVDIEPPGLDLDGDDDELPQVAVLLTIVEADGTSRTSRIAIDAGAPDDALADALVACTRGVAAMRGPGLTAAVEKRIAGARP